MHIIVVGCGNVGSQLGVLLSSEGHDVVLIDEDPGAFKRLGGTFNGLKIIGHGHDEEILREAGIERCDAFAAVTNLDNTNMMAAEIASHLYKVPRVVARIYKTELEGTLQQLGMDYVCGTTIAAQAILDKLVGEQGHYLTMRGDLKLIEFIAGREVENKKIVDIQIPNQFRICLVTREGSSFIPWRETTLKEQDVVLAVVQDRAYGRIKKYIRGR